MSSLISTFERIVWGRFKVDPLRFAPLSTGDSRILHRHSFPRHRRTGFQDLVFLLKTHALRILARATRRRESTTKGNIMLSYAITFLVIALIAALLGFGGIAGAAVGIAKILFFVFLVLFVLSLIMGGMGRGHRV
jgi:uncharacterized membrane protein YtjA (UPF0391 family)